MRRASAISLSTPCTSAADLLSRRKRWTPTTKASTAALLCGSSHTHSPLLVCSTTAGISATASSYQCTSASSSSSLSEQRRGYKHYIKDDLVPKGAKTTRFQSSNVPSERRKVLQEYALAPLFGARISALLLGSSVDRKTFIANKKKIAETVDDLLGLEKGTTELGETRWLSDSTFPRNNTSDYMRTCPRTGALLAGCLVGVYFPSDIPLLEQLDLGARLADFVSGATPDERLTRSLGVTYCEFEYPELNHFEPSTLLGSPVDVDEAIAVVDRWEDRVEDQMSLWETTKAEEEVLRGGRVPHSFSSSSSDHSSSTSASASP